MGFHDSAVFPSQIAVDSTFGWGFNTNILASNTGSEQRVARREVAQHTGDVSTGIQDPEQLLELKAFHLARRGALYGFRFKDPLDHLSTEDDPCAPNTVIAASDQFIANGDGSQTIFQLIKTYTDSNYSYVRKITKPIPDVTRDTVLVQVAGTGLIEDVDFTINYSTGEITFTTAPVNLAEIRAGYEFHTPVRFELDADRAIDVAFQEFKYGSIPRIGIIEILDDDFAPDSTWNGGAYTYTGTASTTLSTAQGRYSRLNLDGATSSVVYVPDASKLPEGGPYFYIHNVGTTYSYPIYTIGLTEIVAAAAPSSLYAAFVYYNASLASNAWVLVQS